MKKIFLMITLVAGFSTATFAQDGKKTPEKRADHMTKALQKKLNLSTYQANQVHAIMFEQASRMDSIKLNVAGGDRKEVRLSRREIMQATDQKLSALLNPDQLKGFEAWKATRKNKMHDKKQGKAPAAAAPTTQG